VGALSPASAGFFIGLHFSPQDGGDTFLLNIGLSLSYTCVGYCMTLSMGEVKDISSDGKT
jgi:hypothetical protein